MNQQLQLPNGGQHTVQDLINDVLESARKLMEMEIAFVSEFHEGYRVFRFVGSDLDCCPVQVGAGDPLEDSYCARVVDGRLPELLPDARDHEEALKLPVTQALPVGGHISVPILMSDGRIYGTFCCFSSDPKPLLSDKHVVGMRLFADLVAKALEREAEQGFVYGQARARVQRMLDQQNFEIHYQPIINVAQDKLVSYEALARFRDEPALGPDQWFALADRVGLQETLEYACIRKAVLGLSQIPASSYLSLNISPDTILAGRLAQELAGLPLNRLVLEITEHVGVQEYERVAQILAPLRAGGLRIAVDDAGAGFASFRHILRLKPDVIKLDRSLIHDIDTDINCRALAAALIRFAEETGARIVAEGVETAEELRVLRELKVESVQGYLLGRPTALLQVQATAR